MTDYQPLLVAAVGVAGTLLGALLTQLLAARAESARRIQEQTSRWRDDRRDLGSKLIGLAIRLERKLWDVASFLERDSRDERLPHSEGIKTILLLPREGTADISSIDLEILTEAVEQSFSWLGEMEDAAADLFDGRERARDRSVYGAH